MKPICVLLNIIEVSDHVSVISMVVGKVQGIRNVKCAIAEKITGVKDRLPEVAVVAIRISFCVHFVHLRW